MKAIVVAGDALAWREVETPSPGPGEVRIAVRAAGVNRADLLQRAGAYPPPPGASPILGLECSGVIDAVGPGAGFEVGAAVCALLAGGAYAERVVAPAGQVLPIPGELGFVEAAAVPEAFATAYLNLWMEAALAPGERVLVHAGGSGVGTAAVQLCVAHGNPCAVTAGSDEKIARCLALGAEAGANRKREGFSHLGGFDVILDPVGGPYLDGNLRILDPGGRLVIIGIMGGRTGELDLGRLLVKRLRIVGSVLRSRSVAEKSAIVARLVASVAPLLATGRVRPVLDRVFPIEEAEEAHRLVASDDTFGKVVLAVP